MHRHTQDARARYEFINETAQGIIFIEDVGHNHTISVTNDAEAVVYEIVNKYGDKRIVYKDSMGNWDELLHDGDQFTGFAPYARKK
jgi:hypothetical protein